MLVGTKPEEKILKAIAAPCRFGGMGITTESKEAIKEIYEEASRVNQRLWDCLINGEASQTDESARDVVKNIREAKQKEEKNARIKEASSD